MERIRVTQLKEIILVSKDVAASRRFYRELLDFPMPEEADKLNMAAVGPQFFGTAAEGVMSGVGLGGYIHLGWEVEHADFEPAVELLRARGVEVKVSQQRPGWMDAPASVGAYFKDPDGNLIELWARLPAEG